ncbi:Na+/H+ antiporter subunit E [Okibacterium endophyticum]
MSPVTERRATSIWSRLVLTVGLVLLWSLLWGDFSLLTILTGIVLAVVVAAVFFLPAIDWSGRVNPWYVVVYFSRLLVDIVLASIEVAWLVLKPRYEPSNAILAVALHTRSDLIMTWTAGSVSIVPGSIVVDIDREESVLYVHALNVTGADDLEGVRSKILGTESRLAHAVGSAQDVERVRQGREARLDVRSERHDDTEAG